MENMASTAAFLLRKELYRYADILLRLREEWTARPFSYVRAVHQYSLLTYKVVKVTRLQASN